MNARAFGEILRAEERAAWEACLGRNAVRVKKGEELVSPGDRVDSLIVVLSGWSQRYKQLRCGRRQILSLYLPGEICDQDALSGQRATTALAGVRELDVARIHRDEALELFQYYPGLERMRRASITTDMRIEREWAVSLGLRNAEERIAHLCCELLTRQGCLMRGSAEGHLPLTQAQIGEALGLTPVHVNRTVRTLRTRYGLDLRSHSLRTDDAGGLASLAQFDGSYLILHANDLCGRAEGGARAFPEAEGSGIPWRPGAWHSRSISGSVGRSA